MGTCIRSVFVEFTSRENALERLPRFGRKPTVFFSTVEYKSCLDSRPFCANDLIMIIMILFCALPRLSHQFVHHFLCGYKQQKMLSKTLKVFDGRYKCPQCSCMFQGDELCFTFYIFEGFYMFIFQGKSFTFYIFEGMPAGHRSPREGKYQISWRGIHRITPDRRVAHSPPPLKCLFLPLCDKDIGLANL